MTGSLTPQSAGASDDLGTASYKVTGTGTANDAHRVPGVALIDPTTGLPYAASGGTGGGGGAVTVADGADVAQGTTTDTSSALTLVGLLKNIKAALAGTLTISGAVTNANLDVALSTRLKPADTLAAVTTVGAVTAITNPLPAGSNSIGYINPDSTPGTVVLGSAASQAFAISGVDLVAFQALSSTLVGTVLFEGTVDGTNWITLNGLQTGGTFIASLVNPAVGATVRVNTSAFRQVRIRCSAYTSGTSTWQANEAIEGGMVALSEPLTQRAQTTVTTTMQSAVTANGNGTVVTTDGYNGAILIFISNSTGTATVTIEGSLDSAFTAAQDVVTLGLYKLSDSGAGTYTSRSIVGGTIAVAASTSYLYAVADSFPYVRARVSGQASLAALTVKCYAVPS